MSIQFARTSRNNFSVCFDTVNNTCATMDIYQVISRPSSQYPNLDNSDMDDIVYKPIYSEKANDVIKHLRDNFFADEPLNRSLNLTKFGQPHEELEEYSLQAINQGVSLMAVHSTTGEVAGVLLNGFKTEDSKDSGIKETYNDPKLQKIFDFLGGVDKDVNFLTQYNVRDIFELRMLSVDKKFRGRGIGGKLSNLSEKLAQSKGFSLLRADATAFLSQRLFEKMGFQTIKEIVYAEYPSKESPLFKVEPPNTSFKLMVKKIDNC